MKEPLVEIEMDTWNSNASVSSNAVAQLDGMDSPLSSPLSSPIKGPLASSGPVGGDSWAGPGVSGF